MKAERRSGRQTGVPAYFLPPSVDSAKQRFVGILSQAVSAENPMNQPTFLVQEKTNGTDYQGDD
jgi:hypothetical protein